MPSPTTAAPLPRAGEAVPVSLLELAGVFAKIGLMSFGGALSGWMHREIVMRRRWLDEADFLNGLALGQIMPGANVANLSLYIGHKLRGGRGAIAALTGMLLPPMLLVVMIAAAFGRIKEVAPVHRFVDGVAAAAIGLTAMVGVRAARRIERRAAPLAVLAVTFLAIGVFRLPMVPVVVCVTPISIALAWPRKRGDDA